MGGATLVIGRWTHTTKANLVLFGIVIIKKRKHFKNNITGFGWAIWFGSEHYPSYVPNLVSPPKDVPTDRMWHGSTLFGNTWYTGCTEVIFQKRSFRGRTGFFPARLESLTGAPLWDLPVLLKPCRKNISFWLLCLLNTHSILMQILMCDSVLDKTK